MNEDKEYYEESIKKLEADKSKAIGFLSLACLGLLILVPLYFSSNSLNKHQADIINTCVSEVSDVSSKLSGASDALSSMNDKLDGITSDASNAAGDDYGTQASTLDNISSTASEAKNTDDFTPSGTSCTRLDSGS